VSKPSVEQSRDDAREQRDTLFTKLRTAEADLSVCRQVLHEREGAICQLNWLIENMLRAANGQELSDFDESELAVRVILDLKSEAVACRQALAEAIETLRCWHGMGMGAAEEDAWRLYQESPEMKRINAALVR
jgi:hypothetical protein